MTDDRDYMTPVQFASLPLDVQLAVWAAHAAGQIDSIPATAGAPDGMQRYHRGQVLALRREIRMKEEARSA